MSVINFSNLELIIAEKISSATSPLEIQTYSKALAQIKHGTIYTVINFSDLPATQDSAGLLYYVSNEETVYISIGDIWFQFGSNNNIAVSFGRHCYGMAGPLLPQSGCYSSPVQEFCNSKNWTALYTADINLYGIKQDGTIWAWGYAGLGHVPADITYSTTSPVQEISSSTWSELKGTMQNGHAIKNDGTLWTWGRCGNGNPWANNAIIGNCSSPVQEITSSTNWSKLSNTTDHSHSMFAIKTDGTMWGYGYNTRGNLAVGDYLHRSSPTQEFCSATNWCFSTTSPHHSFGIKTDGTMWGTGTQFHGALGNGICSTLCINSWHQEVCGATNWCFAAAALCSSLAIKTDGTMWNWGNNFNGLLGGNLPYPACVCSTSPIQEITSSTLWCSGSGASYTKYGLKSDGTLYFWGDGNYSAAACGFPVVCASSPVAETNPLLWCQISTSSSYTLGGVLAVPYYT